MLPIKFKDEINSVYNVHTKTAVSISLSLDRLKTARRIDDAILPITQKMFLDAILCFLFLMKESVLNSPVHVAQQSVCIIPSISTLKLIVFWVYTTHSSELLWYKILNGFHVRDRGITMASIRRRQLKGFPSLLCIHHADWLWESTEDGIPLCARSSVCDLHIFFSMIKISLDQRLKVCW